MCHLTGYVGNDNAIPLLLETLRVQEPIVGAQATGLAVMKKEKITLKKTIGPVSFFKKEFNISNLESNVGIAHTRFALKNVNRSETNTKEKAHPFWNSNELFVTMHNGTIANYFEFVKKLEKMDYKFRSKSNYTNIETGEKVVDYCDSEIFSYMLEEELNNGNEMKKAIRNACKNIKGHFAFVVIHPEHPEKIFIANWMQPLYIGFTKTSSYFTSFNIGFSNTVSNFKWKFEPPKNSLIVLSKGNVSVEPLIAKRKLPEYSVNSDQFKQVLFEAIKKNKNNLVSILLYIAENTEEIGLTKEQHEKISTIGGLTFTPIIYHHLMELVKENKVTREIKLVSEGGIDTIPRYHFFLKN